MQVRVETQYGTLDFPIDKYGEIMAAIKAAKRPIMNAIIAENIKKNAKIVLDRRGLEAIGKAGLPAIAHWKIRCKKKICKISVELGDRYLAYDPKDIWDSRLAKIDYEDYLKWQETPCVIIPDDLMAREIEYWRSDGRWLVPAANWHIYAGQMSGIPVQITRHAANNMVICVDAEGNEYEMKWNDKVPADAYLINID